jgi:hypothetical protein
MAAEGLGRRIMRSVFPGRTLALLGGLAFNVSGTTVSADPINTSWRKERSEYLSLRHAKLLK